MNKKIYLVIALTFAVSTAIFSQSVLNSADTLVNYDGTNQPSLPTFGQIGKWMRTKSLSWNTDSFKAYIYKGSAFRLRFPKSYNPNAVDGKQYPLIIVFHGGGESGPITDNETQLYNGAQALSNYSDNGSYDGFLLFMQSQGKWGSGQYQYLTEIAKYMITNNKLDPFRINVTGLSAGGQASWEMALFNTNYVASSLPMSNVSIGYADTDVVNQLKFMPVWNFQGALDGSPAPYTAEQVNNAMIAAGGNYTYTEYPTLAHGVWNAAFAEPNFLPFVLNAYQSNPWTLYGRTSFCPGTSINVTVGLSRGFDSYQWRKNGALLSSATNTINVTDTGTYDARVLRGQIWSDWSHIPVVISFKGPTITPPITISGLMSDVIPAADGNNYVNLQIPDNGYTSYKWKKVGSDSIIGTQRILKVTQPGSYIVSATEKYGCSSVYSQPFAVYNAAGTTPPSAATNLVATSLSNTSIELDWSENPHPNYIETGFEIYRSTTSGGPYTYAGIVPTDTLIFKDNSLTPNVTYYYKIRAVNNNGAAPLSNEASATTQSDKTPPTAPPNLRILFTTENSISLAWDSSTDNIKVTAYDIFLNGVKYATTLQNTQTINGLQALQTYVIYVKAKDAAGNYSTQSNQLAAITAQKGLLYKYYQGSWTTLPDFSLLTPLSSGISSNTDLSVKLRSFQYGMLWQGYIRIPVAGKYIFGTKSDDGSKLWLGTYNASSTPNVNNDGIHYDAYQDGTQVTLQAGLYPISIAYFQVGAQNTMAVYWKSKNLFGDNDKRPIDDQYFSIDTLSLNGTAPLKPGTVTLNALSYDKMNISWIDSSNNETAFEIFRSTLAVGPFNIAGTVGANATQFIDSGLTASSKYYYKVRAINNYGASDFTLKLLGSTLAVPPAPLAATNLVIKATSSSIINLTWQDNAANEVSYSIYRAGSISSNYRLIASLPANTVSFTDSSLFSNLTYYYKVIANGVGSTSAASAVVFATTLNNSPAISKISAINIPYGVTSTIPLTGTDLDGDSLYFAIDHFPSFASLTDNHNKTAVLTLNPSSTNLGTYSFNRVVVYDTHGGTDTTIFKITVNSNFNPAIDSIGDYAINENDNLTISLTAHDQNTSDVLSWSASNLPNAYTLTAGANGTAALLLHPNYAAAGNYLVKVTVSDGNGGTAVRQFNLTVLDKSPSPVVYIRFKDQDAIGSPWNNVTGVTSTNFLDNNGNNTNIGLAMQTSWFATYRQGPNTGNNSGVYPDAVLKDYYYFGYNGGPSTVATKVTGLDTNTTYSFTFYAGSNFSGVTDNGNTNYTIGTQTVSLYVQNNTQNTVSINNLKPAADGTITFTMSKAANAQVGYINALVISGSYDDGSAPLAPQSLTAQAVQGAIKVNWQDAAFNETAFQVYRSLSATGAYTLIKTISAPNTQTYTDSSVNGFTTYYYKLKTINSHGSSVFSNIASATSLNRIPSITAVSNIVLKNNQILQVQVNASDDVTDHLTLTANNLPSFATFTDNGNGTGVINLNPSGTIGGFTGITITATDISNASASSTFDITVVDNLAPSIYLNFTNSTTLADKPWNNITGAQTAGSSFINPVDDSNTPTTLKVTMPDGFQGVSSFGMKQGNGKGVYSDSVMLAGEYDNSSTTRRIVISGLTKTKKYNFVFFNSHNDGTSCLTNFTINTQTVSLDAMYNINKTVQINGIFPDTTGTITISVAKASGAATAVISSLVIQSYDTTAFLSPSDLRVTSAGTNTVSLQWADRSDSETVYQVWRANDSLSTYSLIKSLPSNTTSYIDSNLFSNKTYYYIVRSGKNTTYSSYSNIAAGHTYSYSVYINFTFNNDASFPWNNTNSLPTTGLVVNNLLDANSYPTGTGMNVTGTFDGLFTGGMSTGNNSGAVPDKVMTDSYGLFTGNSSTIKITGLNFNLKYDFSFFASANVSGDVNTIYSIGSKKAILNTSMNTSGMVTIADIVPDSNGEITINIAPNGSTSQFGLIGALIIQGYTPTLSSAPGIPVGLPGKEILTAGRKAINDNKAAVTAPDNAIKATAYPNPFTSYFTLSIPLKTADAAEVLIYNAAGKLCYQNTFAGLFAGNNTVRINANHELTSAGIYLVKISYRKTHETQTVQLIKLQ